MKTKFLGALLAGVALLAISCREPEEIKSTLDIISEKNYELGYDGGTLTISFETNSQWTVSCAEAWVEISEKEGKSGAASVVLTVAKNTSWEARNAEVAVTAGSAKDVITIAQDFEHVLSLDGDASLTIGSKAGKYKVSILHNEDVDVTSSVDWLTVAETKAGAPVKNSYDLSYTENASVEERTAKVTFKSASSEIVLSVVQEASTGLMVPTKVLYISNSEDVFDGWSVGTHAEYVLDFDVAGGVLRLALNSVRSNDPLSAIPTGEFEVDAEAVHADGTISVSGDKYYTSITLDGREIVVSDCLAEVSKAEDGAYALSVILSDVDENIYEYSYSGVLPEIEDASEDGLYVGVTRGFDYNTHFANKANETSVTLVPSLGVNDEFYLRYLSLDFYSEELAEILPEGTYVMTDVEPDMIDSNYANGITNYLPGKIYTAYGYAPYNADRDYDNVVISDAKTTITKNADGTFDISYSASGKAQLGEMDENGDLVYDDDYNMVVASEKEFSVTKEFKNVVISVDHVSDGLKPQEDTDDVFKSMMTVQSLWFGKPYTESGVDGNVYVMSFSSVNDVYTVNLPLVDDGSWTFVGNGASTSYCKDPFTPGTYTVERGYTPKTFSVGYLKAATYAAVITNSYTGSKYRISRGSVTLDADGNVTFDLYGKPSTVENELHFTGKLSSVTPYGARDRSQARYAAYVAWYPAPTE